MEQEGEQGRSVIRRNVATSAKPRRQKQTQIANDPGAPKKVAFYPSSNADNFKY